MKALRPDGSVNVLVESPRGSAVKFEYDAHEKIMTLSRPLPLGLVFPFDWGCIPGTRAADGDPLDAFILWDGTTPPGIVIPCRPVGLLRVQQANEETRRRERNDRVAMVPLVAPRQDGIRSALRLEARVRREIEQFFVHAVAFEGKQLRLLGWGGPQAATTAIRLAVGNDRSGGSGPGAPGCSHRNHHDTAISRVRPGSGRARGATAPRDLRAPPAPRA